MNADPEVPPSSPRFAFVVVLATLVVVYAATIAPTVTLWDAGEFHAAIASLGIPHPPGTPLYIIVGNVWAKALGFLPLPLAVNLLSACATAVACASLAVLMTQWTGSRLAGIAGGLASGSMLAVWLNATEAEVYAVSTLLGVLIIVAGERARVTGRRGYRLVLAYLIALAVPVQVSALVAAPAAILLASLRRDGAGIEWRRLMALGGVLASVIAISQGSTLLLAVGLGMTLSAAVRRAPGESRVEPVLLLAVAGLGLSPTLIMLVRAAYDPLINQGNPATFSAMMDVVTRQQYTVPGIWPRRAPIWIQLLNLFQYADWQFASGLDWSVAASWRRTPWSLVALVMLVTGARWHWQRHARSALAVGLLLLSATLGVVVMLNNRAGPSILDSVLPPGARHEPRERDYFYALGFATAGVWIGAGAVVLARRWIRPGRVVTPVAIGLAALPILLNWRAASRRPDAMIAPTYGESLLASLPPRAVILMAGDNDSYATWFQQAVHRERPDVVPVTIPLLGADWYRAELHRRHQLLDKAVVATWHGEGPTLKSLAETARRQDRPLAASNAVAATIRAPLAEGWTLSGMAYVAGEDPLIPSAAIDTIRTRAVAELIARRIPRPPRARDPAVAHVARLLACPQSAIRLGIPVAVNDSGALLDSRCNFK